MNTRRFSITIISALALAVALGGCGKKKGGEESKSKRVDTWLKKSFEKKTGTVKGQAFEIQLPAGLKVLKKSGTVVRWSPKGGDEFDYPQFEVSTTVWMPPTSAADAVKKHKSDKMNKGSVILKSKDIDGGILLVYRNGNSKSVAAKLFRKKGKLKIHAYCLWIRPSDEDGKIPQIDKVAAWVEKTCLTFKLK